MNYASTAGGGAMGQIKTARKQRSLTRAFLTGKRRGGYRRYSKILASVKVN